MKKNSLKKIMAVGLVAANICTFSTPLYAQCKDTYDESEPIVARYTNLFAVKSDLIENSNGSLGCSGITNATVGYKSGIIMKLQQKNGSWTTIKTWSSDSETNYVSIYADIYVTSGYEYRLVTYHYAYDSDWNVVESTVKYSSTISK